MLILTEKSGDDKQSNKLFQNVWDTKWDLKGKMMKAQYPRVWSIQKKAYMTFCSPHWRQHIRAKSFAACWHSALKRSFRFTIDVSCFWNVFRCILFLKKGKTCAITFELWGLDPHLECEATPLHVFLSDPPQQLHRHRLISSSKRLRHAKIVFQFWNNFGRKFTCLVEILWFI